VPGNLGNSRSQRPGCTTLKGLIHGVKDPSFQRCWAGDFSLSYERSKWSDIAALVAQRADTWKIITVWSAV